MRALEKGVVRGFEGLETASIEEVNALEEMEKAKREIKEREERKAVTKNSDGEVEQPKLKINVSVTIAFLLNMGLYLTGCLGFQA